MVVHLDYNVSSWPWFGPKPIVRVKTSFKKLSGGGWVVVVVVHLDYNVSSWPWFGQKSNRVKTNLLTALKSYGVGGGWWCTWIITSALWPLFVKSQMSTLREFQKRQGPWFVKS